MLVETLKNKLSKWFSPKKTTIKISESKSVNKSNNKTLENLEIYDDVKIICSTGKTLEGWVIEKTSTSFSIVFTDEFNKLQEITKIPIERPLNRSDIYYKDFLIQLI